MTQFANLVRARMVQPGLTPEEATAAGTIFDSGMDLLSHQSAKPGHCRLVGANPSVLANAAHPHQTYHDPG
jgi:hypothetical protein